MVAQFYRYILKVLCDGFNFQLHWTEKCLEYQQKHSYEVGGGGSWGLWTDEWINPWWIHTMMVLDSEESELNLSWRKQMAWVMSLGT